MNKRLITTLLCAVSITTLSCNKQDDWLDVKPNKSDVSPSSLKDYQAILDFNTYMNADYSFLGMVSSDNYYVTYDSWQTVYAAQERNAYIWLKDIYAGEDCPDWYKDYLRVQYANIVLDGLKQINRDNNNQNSWDYLQGAALFFRAHAFYNLAQQFAPPYNSSFGTNLGIPLRLNSDVNEKSIRSTTQQTYDQIIKDLVQAEQLLPTETSYKTRPSKVSSDALLARVYLNIADYKNAEKYATKAISAHDSILDFNSLTLTSTLPFPRFQAGNKEILFYATATTTDIVSSSYLLVDSLLYLSYEDNDLRKQAFFRSNGTGGYYFKGNYTGLTSRFAGIAINETYLIRAECRARLGNTTGSMDDLNSLLRRRWKNGVPYPIITANNAPEAVKIILRERRKELPFTGILRWEDLRRLNKDPLFAKVLYRTLNGIVYSLPPNDNKYVLPIPAQEVLLSGIPQNER